MEMKEDISLWICPSSKTHKTLLGLMEKIIEKYGPPVWPPHITLLPQIKATREEGIELVEKLFESFGTKPLKLTLETVVTGTKFFQCVMVKVLPEEPLMKLNQTAQTLFKDFYKGDTVYFPHLSLVYGDKTQEEKSAIADEINHTFEAENMLNTCVEIDSIQVWSTRGGPNTWELLSERPFNY